MFNILKIGNWQGVGGSEYIRMATDGIEAIRFRENHGLPIDKSGRIRTDCEEVCDRRAAESWPEGLNYEADLPLVLCADGVRKPNELHAMILAGIVVSTGPKKFGEESHGQTIGLGYKLAVSPIELVAWRRAWHAEQEAHEAAKEIAELKARITELESEEQGFE